MGGGGALPYMFVQQGYVSSVLWVLNEVLQTRVDVNIA